MHPEPGCVKGATARFDPSCSPSFRIRILPLSIRQLSAVRWKQYRAVMHGDALVNTPSFIHRPDCYPRICRPARARLCQRLDPQPPITQCYPLPNRYHFRSWINGCSNTGAGRSEWGATFKAVLPAHQMINSINPQDGICQLLMGSTR